jgi:hypothetical protein
MMTLIQAHVRLLSQTTTFISGTNQPQKYCDIEHDVTTGLGGGKVLWLNTTGASDRNGTVGEITTPLLNTTGKCLMLFHYVSYRRLAVSAASC